MHKIQCNKLSEYFLNNIKQEICGNRIKVRCFNVIKQDIAVHGTTMADSGRHFVIKDIVILYKVLSICVVKSELNWKCHTNMYNGNHSPVLVLVFTRERYRWLTVRLRRLNITLRNASALLGSFLL